MLHSVRNKLAVLYHCPEHLRDRMLSVDAILLVLFRQADVDATALSSRDLDTEAVL